MIKQNESLFLMNEVNCEETMKRLSMLTGPISDDEINFYYKALRDNNGNVIHEFQKELIFNMFYKYFGDPVSINAINTNDYIKLMIIAKRILQSYNLKMLPYIISSKITAFQKRKTINKKELLKVENSPYYDQVKLKYKSDKINNKILSLMATILSSEFKIIDFNDNELNNEVIEPISDIISEEILMYVMQI